ncbi:MAG TPA: DUF4446 family protein [Candidatus Baltobacteraceae bacterium]
MDQTAIIAAGAALLGALIALAIYHAALVRPALLRSAGTIAALDDAVGGAPGPASGRIATLEAGVTDLRAGGQRVEARLVELERLARADLALVGFVRFSAFENTGSELSYALALLSRAGDGVVVSSIYSRDDTRTFGKAVVGFRPVANASDEELLAIEHARNGSG